MKRNALVPGFDDGTLLRSLFAAYPDALLVVDLQGVIGLANPAAVELLGYGAQELVGLSVDALVPDAIRPRHAAYRSAYADHPRARPMGMQMDLVAKRRDGSEVMVEIALSPLQDHGLPYVVAAIRGVGAYPRVKQALQRARYAEYLAQFGRLAVDARESQRLLAFVPTIAAEALQVEMVKIALLEPSGLEFRIVAGVGLPPEECIGDRIPDQPSSPPGDMVSELSVPLADRGRTIGVLTVRSRTPRRFGEDEMRFLDALSNMLATALQRTSSEEALNHAQRLETVGQLTGGVAHDFNNLLTVISGNLQVLAEAPACAGDPFIQQLVGAAARATRRGAELTSKLLAFSRRQVLQPTIVDTPALLHSLTDMLRRTLDQRIVITLDTDDALCLVDPVQLESALLNVAINARDAMAQGGKLDFACRRAAALPSELDADRDQPHVHGYVAISISDNGTGMPDAVKERAFEPFFTTKESGRGTGLGLSTVYGFARQSRGAVGLRSAPGAGTTVTLYLPRAEHAGATDSGFGAAPPGTVPAGLRVLLVEDDAEVRSVVRTFLAAMACEVVACADADQALRALASDPRFGLLLTDVMLGAGMRGTELAQAARARLPGLPVLLMSGFSSDLLEAPAGGELLRKPFARTDLEQAMAKALGAAQ